MDETKTYSESTTEDEEEDNNLCLMAIYEVNSKLKYTSDEDIFIEIERLLKALRKQMLKLQKSIMK